jgi:hypothetical protein
VPEQNEQIGVNSMGYSKVVDGLLRRALHEIFKLPAAARPEYTVTAAAIGLQLQEGPQFEGLPHGGPDDFPLAA